MLASLYQQLIGKLIQIITIMNPDALLPDWSLIPAAHHNVRALCDLEGLSHQQKQVLTACVMQESGFDISAQNHGNSNGTADYGIVQVNTIHIGTGLDFPSIDYVLTHPEECVRWMCRYYKTHGHLNAWSSYKFGAYKKYLGKV